MTFFFPPEKDYENAIKYYSEALEVNPSNAIYYSNRSLAYLRTECYGYALADATKALEIDKNYIKGYYRRATSNMALGKFKAALKDYETVRHVIMYCQLKCHLNLKYTEIRNHHHHSHSSLLHETICYKAELQICPCKWKI